MSALDACKQAGHHPLPVGYLSCIQNVIRLLEATDELSGNAAPESLIQMWHSFSLIWGIGAVINSNGRPVYGP